MVWTGEDGSVDNDREIYLWNGATITQLTDNTTSDYWPDVSGSNVVWYGPDAGDNEIYLWNGATTTQITNNSTEDFYPAISGSNLAWNSYDGHDYKIYLWQGGTARVVISSSTQDRFPDISASKVVWEGYDGSDWEIYMAAAIPLPALSTPAVAVLAGLLLGTAFLLIRRLGVGGA